MLMGGLIGWIVTRVAVRMASNWLRQDPPAVVACRAYSKGEPFMKVVEAYVNATPHSGDDDVLSTLAEVNRQLQAEPFRKVIDGLIHHDEAKAFIQSVVDRVVEE